MAFLFDTDAISELLRPRPAINYIKWLMAIPREEQFTSSIVIGELYKGAYRSEACERHLSNIEQLILPAVTVLPFDIGTAKIFGKIRAHLEETGTILHENVIPFQISWIARTIHPFMVLVDKWISGLYRGYHDLDGRTKRLPQTVKGLLELFLGFPALGDVPRTLPDPELF